MSLPRRLVLLLVACLVGLLAPAVAPASAHVPVTPLLTGVRAAHHPGFDRVVFDFWGGVPSNRQLSYVSRLVADGSGNEVPIAGRAILQVRFEPARGFKFSDGRDTSPNRVTFPLPNVLTVVQSGDFEAVVTYGIGLASRQPYRVFTLSNPPRVVVDIGTRFSWTNRRVWFFDSNAEPRSVVRPILVGAPAHGLVDRLFAGPTASERARGLHFVASGATDFTGLRISSGNVARIRLLGGCSSGGSTSTIAGELTPTLKQLGNVSWVKVYDPAGRTERPWGRIDSIPECLEP